MSDCKHDKVYDNQHLLTSFPPQRKWICRLCGEEGTETVGAPENFANEYEAIKEKFNRRGT